MTLKANRKEKALALFVADENLTDFRTLEREP